jgi:hypothetical protein
MASIYRSRCGNRQTVDCRVRRGREHNVHDRDSFQRRCLRPAAGATAYQYAVRGESLRPPGLPEPKITRRTPRLRTGCLPRETAMASCFRAGSYRRFTRVGLLQPHQWSIADPELNSEPLQRISNERLLVDGDGWFTVDTLGPLDDGGVQLCALGKSGRRPTKQLASPPNLSTGDHPDIVSAQSRIGKPATQLWVEARGYLARSKLGGSEGAGTAEATECRLGQTHSVAQLERALVAQSARLAAVWRHASLGSHPSAVDHQPGTRTLLVSASMEKRHR